MSRPRPLWNSIFTESFLQRELNQREIDAFVSSESLLESESKGSFFIRPSSGMPEVPDYLDSQLVDVDDGEESFFGEDLLADADGQGLEAGAKKPGGSDYTKAIIVLLDIVAATDAAKNVAAFATGNFTVAGALDTAADVASVATQLIIYLKTVRWSNPLVVGSGVLFQTLAVISAVEGATGFGRPETGGSLASDAERFDSIRDLLHNCASPHPDRWSGRAAENYSQINAQQCDFAAQLAELDRRLAALMEKQAAQVGTVRNGLAGLKAFIGAMMLVLASLVAASVAMGDETGQTVRKWVNRVVLVAALTILGLVIYQITEAAFTSAAVNEIRAAYDSVAAKAAARAQPSGPLSTAAPPVPAAAAGSPANPAAAGGPVFPVVPGSSGGPVFPAAPAAAGAAPAAAADPAAAAVSGAVPEAADTSLTAGAALGTALQMEPALAQAATQGMQSVQQFAQMAAQAGRSSRPAPDPGGEGPRPVDAGQPGAPDTDPPPSAAGPGAATGTGRAPTDTTGPGPAPAAEPTQETL